MDTIDQAELVIRQAGADTLLAALAPRLFYTGWHVTINAEDGARSLLASKGVGRICLPGGRGDRWATQVAEIELTDCAPADRRGLLPEFDELPVWRVELDPAVPVDLILLIAERAADGPGSVLAAAA